MWFRLRLSWCDGRDRIVVSTSRCGRDNPGSNPGHGRAVVSLSWHNQPTFTSKRKKTTQMCVAIVQKYIHLCPKVYSCM